jgi:hypothetical protein
VFEIVPFQVRDVSEFTALKEKTFKNKKKRRGEGRMCEDKQ